jgi:hypothetical protein
MEGHLATAAHAIVGNHSTAPAVITAAITTTSFSFVQKLEGAPKENALRILCLVHVRHGERHLDGSAGGLDRRAWQILTEALRMRQRLADHFTDINATMDDSAVAIHNIMVIRAMMSIVVAATLAVTAIAAQLGIANCPTQTTTGDITAAAAHTDVLQGDPYALAGAAEEQVCAR